MVMAHFTNKPKCACKDTIVVLDNDDDDNDYCYQIVDGDGCEWNHSEKNKKVQE